MQKKKTVRYKPSVRQVIGVGYGAVIFPVDHPHCSNTKPVYTSDVIKFEGHSGKFETENTLYVPEELVDE